MARGLRAEEQPGYSVVPLPPPQLLFLAWPQSSEADSFESEAVEAALCGLVMLCWRQVTQRR